MGETPLWSLTIDAIGTSITAIAILVGGTIGYVRYLRGRVFHAKLDVDLAIELCVVSDYPSLKIAASIKNEGTCRIAFPVSKKQQVQVWACYPKPWGETCAAASALPVVGDRKVAVEWSYHLTEDFRQGDEPLPELEPGQRMVRQMLLPGIKDSEEPVVAYRVLLYAEGCPHPLFALKEHDPWSTEHIVEVKQHGR